MRDSGKPSAIKKGQEQTKRKNRRRDAFWSLDSPHIENFQGGFSLSQGSWGEPLARELKTEAHRLHHNTMETMDTVEIALLWAEMCCVESDLNKCKYPMGNHGSSGRMSSDLFVFVAK